MTAMKTSLAFLGIAVCLGGCVIKKDNGGGPLSSMHSQRLIIQFKPQHHACNDPGIADLSRSVGISLVLERPMGEGACVVTQFASHPDRFHEQQKRIRAYGAVQWVEQDQRMRAR